MQPGSGAIGGADPAPRHPKLPHANLPAPLAEPATIQDLMKLPVVRKTLRKLGGARLDKITSWLAQRTLLKGVPFEALAPLADLLPPESVRFFYLDTNWLDALLEGALSIGIESSRDRAYQELMKDLIWDATHDAVQRYRDLLLGAQASLIPPGATLPLDREGMTGMLLRSALVSDWPGLEFDGYTGCTFDVDGKTVAPDKHTFMKALRIERLAGDVLLCLWPAVPAAVTIAEPQEGIEFGFEDPPQGKGFYIYLRSLQPGAYGQPCCPDPKTTECDEAVDAGAMIDARTGVVDIAALVGAMEQRLKLTAGTLNVRDFAVQMIRLPEEAIFASSDRK
jgi:hypothetical protein